MIATIFAKTFLKKLFIIKSNFKNMSQQKVVLLLGSNLGDKKKNINDAFTLLQSAGCDIIKKSKILTSEPVEFASSNNFCNIATIINTPFSPIKLLELIKNIEVMLGRLNDSLSIGYYTDRIIDIDIVVYNNIIFDCKKLKIPHNKNLLEREFSKKLIKKLL